MGWQVWDHYESDAQARWKALPWRERYPLRAFAVLAFLAVIVAAFIYATIARAAPIEPGDVRVIDGDTIHIFQKGPNVRLVGFNAPETHRAACEAERELGAKATRRVHDLVHAGNLDFEFVRCDCKLGTEGTLACNHKRACGTLKANNRDVGVILIAERLAVPLQCSETSCPKTPRPWCQY
jgi:endonuclease YncB( thermonuclease family)